MVNAAKFDRQQVVEKACTLFWRKGFHATSARDIQEAVDMRPGSIYATFGSKQGLYTEAVQCYADQMVGLLNTAVDESASVLEGLERFVQRILIDDKDDQPSEVCMLVKANAEFTSEDPALLALSETLLADFETHLTCLFDQAKQHQELTGTRPAVDYARAFQIQFTGLRSYVRHCEDEALTQTLIQQMFTLLKSM